MAMDVSEFIECGSKASIEVEDELEKQLLVVLLLFTLRGGVKTRRANHA